MANWFTFAGNVPLDELSTNLPNVGGALVQWFKPLTIQLVTKNIVAFQNVETATELNFRGIIQPLNFTELQRKPEGQRDWEWKWIHADPSLQLKNDDRIKYKDRIYRVTAVGDYADYGYMSYHIVQDYTGSDPTVTP